MGLAGPSDEDDEHGEDVDVEHRGQAKQDRTHAKGESSMRGRSRTEGNNEG